MKSAGSEDFKTVLDFDIWSSTSWDIKVRTHQGSFSFFTWICKKLSNFISCNHCFGHSKPSFDILHYFIWYFHTNNPGFNQKITKQIYWFLKIHCWNYSEKWLKMTWKCENWKWPLVWLSPNISASTWPKFKIKDSFEILRTSRFQNSPYFLNLVEIWWRYCPKTNCQVFLWTPCMFNSFWFGKLFVCIPFNVSL